MAIRSIIIDDEERGRKTLNNLLSQHCPNIVIVGEAASADAGIQLIKETSPDLVFLDIEMPYGSGFDMLSRMGEFDFDVIFCTAYDEYAIKAFRFTALDYLLKPINVIELQEAVAKYEAKQQLSNKAMQLSSLVENLKGNEFKKITLPTLEGLHFVDIDDIIRCESSGSYTCFYLKSGGKVVVSKPLKEYEELLGGHQFIRVHQSHLINLKYVKTYYKGKGGSIEMIDGSKVLVSVRRRDEFLKLFNLG